jgi:hypothetical protein
MMLDIVETILASHPDLYVAGRISADCDLQGAMRRYHADVLIVMEPDGDSSESSADRLFWCRPSKVIAIAKGGRKGTLYVLRPHATELSELSVDNLVHAIRAGGEA